MPGASAGRPWTSWELESLEGFSLLWLLGWDHSKAGLSGDS